MSSVSRRDFLLKPLTQIQNGLRECQSNIPTHNPLQAKLATKIIIGKISDFPFGEKTEILNLELSVESLPEGLRVQSRQNLNDYYSLQTNRQGQLVVDLQELWPANQVFSLLTGDPATLESTNTITEAKKQVSNIKTPEIKTSKEDRS